MGELIRLSDVRRAKKIKEAYSRDRVPLTSSKDITNQSQMMPDQLERVKESLAKLEATMKKLKGEDK